MTDRRTYLCNGRVAHVSLAEPGEGVKITSGVVKSVSGVVVDLLQEPDGPISRQLLFGDGFLELDVDPDNGFAFGQAIEGGYVGYVKARDLQPEIAITHKVRTMGAHVYAAADIKAPVLNALPFMAKICSLRDVGDFIQINNLGYVHKRQLAPVDQVAPDFTATALQFLGVPYLWGGDSNFGLDCSGLVHASLRAAGKDCPRDSDQQQTLGRPLNSDELLARGDLIFWKSHVALMCNKSDMVHANGYHMAVVREDFTSACIRIAESGGGAVVARRRICCTVPKT